MLSPGPASDNARPLSNGDSLNDSHESRNTGSTVVDSQSNERPTYYALVMGKRMLVPRTYDPDTYDPDARMPWTPEPEPYDPETYAAWGRKHFGEEWYKLRKTMLEERNPYLEYDPEFEERQRALRVIEHEVEGRPFRPADNISFGTPNDEGWKCLWARISSKKLRISSNPASRPRNDNDGDLGGNDADPSISEPHEPTSMPKDPLELLEQDPRRGTWNEEEYQYRRFYLKEWLNDRVRVRRENELGKRQYLEKLEIMEGFRYVDQARFRIEQGHFDNHLSLPKKGWTREEIIAMYEADVAAHEWRRSNPPPKGGDIGETITPEEEEAALASWSQESNSAWIRCYGWSCPKLPANTTDYGVNDLWLKGIYARVSRQRQRETLLSETTGDASPRAAELRRLDDEDQREREALERAVERSRELTKLAHRTNSLPPPQTQQEMNSRFQVWDQLGIDLEYQNQRAETYGFGPRPEQLESLELPQPLATAPQPDVVGDAPVTEQASGRQEESPSRQTSSGRVGQPAPRRTEASPPSRGTRSGVAPGRTQASSRTAPQPGNKQHKVCKKGRTSRRLAKLEPEYGQYEEPKRRPSSRQPARTRRNPARTCRRGTLSKSTRRRK